MSVTDDKVRPVKNDSEKSEILVVSAELGSVLEEAEVRMTTFSRLFIGELNSRLIPHTPGVYRQHSDRGIVAEPCRS